MQVEPIAAFPLSQYGLQHSVEKCQIFQQQSYILFCTDTEKVQNYCFTVCIPLRQYSSYDTRSTELMYYASFVKKYAENLDSAFCQLLNLLLGKLSFQIKNDFI